MRLSCPARRSSPENWDTPRFNPASLARLESSILLDRGTRLPAPTTNPEMPKNSRYFRNRHVLRPTAARSPGPKRATELALAKPHGLGSDLDQLVVVDPGQAVLQAHRVVRSQPHGFVVAGGAHVGQLFLAAHVHVEVHVP